MFGVSLFFVQASPVFLRKIDRLPGFGVCKAIRAFEAADLIACENLRANMTIEGQGGEVHFDELRKPMQRLLNLPGAKEWMRFDQERIEAACSDLPRRRPVS